MINLNINEKWERMCKLENEICDIEDKIVKLKCKKLKCVEEATELLSEIREENEEKLKEKYGFQKGDVIRILYNEFLKDGRVKLDDGVICGTNVDGSAYCWRKFAKSTGRLMKKIEVVPMELKPVKIAENMSLYRIKYRKEGVI